MIRPRFSILSLLLFTAVIAVGAMLYQRHLAWKEAEAEFESILLQADHSPEMQQQVELLVQQYPRLAKKPGTLEWAMRRGNWQLCRHFLELGADPNGPIARPMTGPPLRLAVYMQQAELVRALLEYGADRAILDKTPGPSFNDTLLHVVAARGNVVLGQILLDAGLSIDARNASGQTPLHVAIRSAQVEFVQFLLAQGAACQADYDGKTPRDVAQWRREEHVLAHLDLEPIDEMIRSLEEHCQATPEPTQAVQP